MPMFAVKDIKPNPFRHIDRYPIRKDKVAALRESIRTTGFWDNIVAREKNGKAEIAYGHHRLAALKEEFPGSHKVSLVVRDLSDETMLQIMARENMEEWGSSAVVEHETIRAVVEAYGEGKIELPKPPAKTNASLIRYAPSFVPGDAPGADPEHPYTVQTIAEFIGWKEPSGDPQGKVYDSLAALQFIEEKLLKESDFTGLSTKQAEAVITEARKARDRRETLARLQKQEAERAEAQAHEEEQQRKTAEAARLKAQQEAAAAKSADEKRRASEAARVAEAQRNQAEKNRREAERRGVEARREQEKHVKEARASVTRIGRAVSTSLKEGKIGYRQAAEVALKAGGKSERVPKELEDYARRLATDIGKILTRDDPRTERLVNVIKFADSLNPISRIELAKTLERLAGRVNDYAGQLGGSQRIPESRRLAGGE